MKTQVLIRIGLIAAKELEVPPDAKIVFVPRGNRVIVRCDSIISEKGKRDYDEVKLNWHRELEAAMGYSLSTNSLFVRLGTDSEIT